MNENLTKYLKLLLYLHIASLVKSLIGYLPFNFSWSVWISRGITAGVIFCLFSLIPNGGRYKKAAIFRAVFLVSGFLSGAIPVLVGSLFSILASWQEYHGHSELVEEKDEKLSKQWSRLFGLELLIGILISLVTTIAAMIVVSKGGVGEATENIGVQLIIAIGYVVDVLYLMYMNRTIKLFEE